METQLQQARPARKPAVLPASAASPKEEAARLDQALEDLSACATASVTMIHCPSRAKERALVRDLTARARSRGFVTATVSLDDVGLETPEELLRAVLDALVPPGESRARGLLFTLEGYYDRHGAASADRFAREVSRQHGGGDLSELCRGYLATDDPEAVPETRAYEAWCAGEEPPKKYRNPGVRRPLSERFAQRTFAELTRILRALDHRGLLLVLSEGDALASRTERQREKAYTVLRELVDNFDGAGGAVATRVVLTGQDALFEGDRSVESVAPLRMRLAIPSESFAAAPPPHRTWTTLAAGTGARPHRKVAEPGSRVAGLRDLIRISEGLPPSERVTRMSVGQERLDRAIARLFEAVNRAGSFFSLLVGDYGSGKTHLMMHLAERAIEDRRPVFWLNLERTNLDLGNPARHLSRFLEHSEIPLRGKPNALSLASRWTRSAPAVANLQQQLGEVAAGDGEAAAAARKALRLAGEAAEPGHILESFLCGVDLEARPGDPTYRRDAYRRVFLWFELLARLEEIRGPVILIDEAENLYTSGRPPASRRTSLRSLSFYCGGALPGTCVILALTPPAYEELKGEARDLLAEAGEMETTLELENVERFRRSLWGLKPDPVRPLTRAEREQLCERIRRMHRSVRGQVEFPDWERHIRQAVAAHKSPRTLVRALVDDLETLWWSGKA